MPDGLNKRGKSGLLLTTDAVGGVWRYSLDLAAGLRGRGVEVRLAVLGPAPSVAQREEAADLTLIETDLPLDWTASSPAQLAEAACVLRRLARDADAIHLHAPALAGSDPWPVPLVAVAHSCVATWWQAVRGGALPGDLQWRADATAAGLRCADAIIAPTAAHANAVRACYGPHEIAIVHNGAVPPVTAGGSGDRAVFTAGRLWDEGKNVAALDRIAPLLEVPIRAAGPTTGPHGVAIALANLDLLGTLDAAGMARAYAAHTVYASLARYEPFGLSVLEAALAGMRLVLADIPSFRELWDGVAIFVGREDELPAALRQALGTPIDARGRAQRYTLDAMVDGTLGVHRRIGARV